jgi:hypothetical protein
MLFSHGLDVLSPVLASYSTKHHKISSDAVFVYTHNTNLIQNEQKMSILAQYLSIGRSENIGKLFLDINRDYQ